MPLFELSMVTGAIAEISAEAALKKLGRRETIVRTLKRIGFEGEPPADDFKAIYAFTLVEYGVFKPAPLLDFFRHEYIRDAFRESFEKRDPSLLEEEAESLIEWHKVGDKLRQVDLHPRLEFARFTAVFNEIVDRTRSPVEVKRDHKLEDLHAAVTQILDRVDELTTLDDIRVELEKLNESYAKRRFVFTPSHEKLKVFISSRMLELRDLREMLAQHLKERGLDAWIYEDDAGARPENVVETSLKEVEAADVYVGLFWQQYGEVTAKEYQYARSLDKPCFIYVRDKGLHREEALRDFLEAEVYDPRHGVTYDYFDKGHEFVVQVADDIMVWLVRQHRENTAEIQAAEISEEEIRRLRQEVARFQAMSREELPLGTPADYLARQMRGWFQTLGYQFEPFEERAESHFEWLINVQARRGFDRILVRGIAGEADLGHFRALREAVNTHGADEGWLVARRRVSPSTRDAAEEPRNRDLYCYTFDELIDEDADFSKYLDWLEAEVTRQGIDQMYVPLAGTKEEFDPDSGRSLGLSHYDKDTGWIEGYIDRWLDDPTKEHVSILGEFGTGKTWFLLHYAWIAMMRYQEAKRRGVERPRLPIVIPLRDYAKAVSVESLFSEFFFRKHEIPIPGYSAFEQLNRMGKLLLMFDGFDEMAARIDRQQMINNFWELARVVVPGAKAILTCRTEHFPTALEGRRLLRAELKASTARLSGEPPQFEVLELAKFDDWQIREVLSIRAEPEAVSRILNNRQLVDLLRRPVMSDLVLDALPEIEQGKRIDLSRVYLYAVTRKMERDITSGRTFTSLADKLYFMCELSWEMLSSDRMSLNYRDFPTRLSTLFPHLAAEEKKLDHWHYDMMGQTMLIRNADGDYSPAHRSLLEFFVAYKFAAELGALRNDFTEIARQQTEVNDRLSPTDFTWSEYFRRDIGENGRLELAPPLLDFEQESPELLAKTVGSRPLSPAILELMEKMVKPGPLWACIDATRNRSDEEVGYSGGNATTLLGRLDESFQAKDLANAVLMGAHFFDTDLTKVDLSHAVLRGASFNNCVLRQADLRHADLREATFREMQAVWAVAWSPDGRYLAAGGEDALIRIWDARDFRKRPLVLRLQDGGVWALQWLGEWRLLSRGIDGISVVWNVEEAEVLETKRPTETSYRSSNIFDLVAAEDKPYNTNLRQATLFVPTAEELENRTVRVDHHSTYSGIDDPEKLVQWAQQELLEAGRDPVHVSTFIEEFSRNLHSGQSVRRALRVARLRTLGLGARAGPNKLSEQSWIWQICYRPDGRQVAVGFYSAKIELRETASGECIRVIEHKTDCTGVRFSGAKGVDLKLDDTEKTLAGWLEDRGANSK